VDILSATKEAGLEIHHIGHDQLTSYYFTGERDIMSPDIYAHLSKLKSLRFTVSDVPLEFLPNNVAITRLRKLISASPELENLYIKFESLFPISLDFLPVTRPLPTRLRTLTLFGVSMDTIRFLSFLEMQIDTLKYLSINSAELVEGNGTWEDFLEEMRDKFGSTLEKFQLAGVLRSAEAGGGTWLLSPIYKEDWTDLVYSVHRNSGRTRDVEDFVLRSGPFPMTDEDDISSLLD
jgi:hypothetical protein